MSKSNSASLRNLNDCGCCEGLSQETPVKIDNRPGLSAISYRIGTHGEFKETMLATLSSAKSPALKGLTTRDDTDFTVALLDAWATVADVLTFYQERIANESYLRTATERLSVLELARLVGYELSPGVAASAYLAFTVEDAKGAPHKATIDIGTKVQSVPGQDEQSQIFETIEKIEARAEWNALRPKLTELQTLESGTETVYLKGASVNLNIGDTILIVSGSGTVHRIVKKIDNQPEYDRTQVDVVKAVKQLMKDKVAEQAGKVYVFREHVGFFGHNAPYYESLKDKDGETLYPNLPDWDSAGWQIWKDPIPHKTKQKGKKGKAPNPSAVYYGEADIYLERTIQGILPGSWALLKTSLGDSEIYKVKSVNEKSLIGFGMSARGTGLTLEKPDGTALNNNSTDKPDEFKVRNTTAYVKSEEMELSEEPFVGTLNKGDTEIVLGQLVIGLCTGQTIILTGELKDPKGVTQNEIVVLSMITHVNGYTKLEFKEGLAYSYKYDSVTLNANVALATHGESVKEVLGSGDGSQSYQRFTLRQLPLTYVSSSTPSGCETTLDVRVNDLLWKEVQTLYGKGPEERIYATWIDKDGKTIVQFGDGRTGARPSTGQENIRATYRKGIGLEGLVKAGQLTLLMTRPLGVRDVTNPFDAEGADEQESIHNARGNVPLKVLTLDRIISLKDYEDFARSFAGIAKALATWTWSGEHRVVFITVAGPKGEEIKENSSTCKNLLTAITKAGDPYIPVSVKAYRKALFRITAKIMVDSAYVGDKVIGAAETALESAFSFNARTFGQPVTLSEVMAVIQAVSGVIAVDVDELCRTDGTGSNGLKEPLRAAMPEAGSSGEVDAAELLTLDSGSIKLKEMS